MIFPRHADDACLIEKAHGQRDKQQCEDVGGGGDDGGYDEYENHGMAAVAAHERGGEQSHAREEPRQYGHLEDYAYGETHHDECAHV